MSSTVQIVDKRPAILTLMGLFSCIVLIEKDGKSALKHALEKIAAPNSLILIRECRFSKCYSIILEHIVQAKPSFDCIFIAFWKSLQHIRTLQELIKHFCSTSEPKQKHFLLLIEDIDDSVNCVSILNGYRINAPHGITVSIVAVCYVNKLERMQTSLFDHHLTITDYGVEYSTNEKSNIIGEYLGYYSVAYKDLYTDSIIGGFLSLQLKRRVKSLTELIYLLVTTCLTKYLQSTSENEKNSIFDFMCIKYLETELRKQPMGRYFDVSYIYNYYQLDDEVILRCQKGDKLLMENAAVQDLMIARGIKLLPVSLQIKVLTVCNISKAIYGFYGGLSCPDFCVATTAFDASSSALLDIIEGMLLKQTNVAKCLLCVLHCLYQLQESNLCARFVEKFSDIFITGVDFTGESLTYLDITSLSYFVEVCSSFKWNVAIQDTLLSEGDPERKPSKVTTLKLHVDDYSKINRKKIGPGGNNLIQRLSSHATSEIIYKLLQCISPVPVVCSSKNPGYTSFVSCKCFKEPVLSRIQFDPIIPTHWVTPDQKSSRQFNSLRAYHTEVHGPELLEYVILLSPLPFSVKCILPTNEDIIVKIDCECTGASEGATEEAVRSSNTTSCAGECKKEKLFESIKAKPVFPDFLLSNIMNEKQ